MLSFFRDSFTASLCAAQAIVHLPLPPSARPFTQPGSLVMLSIMRGGTHGFQLVHIGQHILRKQPTLSSQEGPPARHATYSCQTLKGSHYICESTGSVRGTFVTWLVLLPCSSSAIFTSSTCHATERIEHQKIM